MNLGLGGSQYVCLCVCVCFSYYISPSSAELDGTGGAVTPAPLPSSGRVWNGLPICQPVLELYLVSLQAAAELNSNGGIVHKDMCLLS